MTSTSYDVKQKTSLGVKVSITGLYEMQVTEGETQVKSIKIIKVSKNFTKTYT